MKASLYFEITEDDGRSFSSTSQEWGNLNLQQTNWLEGRGIDFLKSLNEFGAQAAAEKAQKGK